MTSAEPLLICVVILCGIVWVGTLDMTDEAMWALVWAGWLAWGAVIFWTGDMK